MHIYDDETETIDTIPFGCIICGYIAHVLNMGDNNDVKFIYDDYKSEFFESTSLTIEKFKIGVEGSCIKDVFTNTLIYKEQAERLIKNLSSVSRKTKQICDEKLYQLAVEFKWFGFNVIRDLPYDLSHDKGKSITQLDIDFFSPYSDENKEFNAHVDTRIQYLGVRCLNGKHCELFRVYDFSIAFCLDLYAYLFENTNESYSIKFCSYCNRFFFAGKGNIKMCPSCRSKKEIDRALRNERSGNNPLQKKVNQIQNYLNNLKGNKSFDDKINDFYKQLYYYKKKLNQKIIDPEDINDQYDKELPVVSCKEDIIQWCDNYHKKVKKEVKEWRKK